MSDHPRLIDEFADLTDWQIVHLYAEPSKRRAEQWDRARRGFSPVPAQPPDDGTAPVKIPTKAYIVGLLVARGWNKKAAEEEYEKQLALTLKKQSENK